MAELSRSAARVQAALESGGFAIRVVELPASTRSAADAAKAIGCEVAQIVKSLIFARADGEPVLVLASGPNRVDEASIAAIVGQAVTLADPAYVRQRAGFAIGGVPPVGHPEPIETLIDRDLLAHRTVWAAAGTPNAVFSLPAADLEGLTGGRVVDVTA